LKLDREKELALLKGQFSSNDKENRRNGETKNNDDDDDATSADDASSALPPTKLPKIPPYSQKRLWGPDVSNMIKMSLGCDSHDLLVELLGTLGNITSLDMPKGKGWANLMTDYNLCNFVSKLLVPGMSQNDVVLETVILIGQFCHDSESQMLIASSSLIRALHELWQDKGDDSEILLQLLHLFYKMLHWPDCREELLYSTEAMADISECVSKRHKPTRFLAEKCLDLILEVSERSGGGGGLGKTSMRTEEQNGYRRLHPLRN